MIEHIRSVFDMLSVQNSFYFIRYIYNIPFIIIP